MHHSSELAREMREAAERLALGATGHYPDGALNEVDEGEIQFGVAADPGEGKVIINFGKPVAWFAMDPRQARALAESLRQRSYQAEGKKLGR